MQNFHDWLVEFQMMQKAKPFANAAADGFISGLTGNRTRANRAGVSADKIHDFYKNGGQVPDADDRIKQLSQWVSRPNHVNYNLVNQQFGNNMQQFNTDFDDLKSQYLSQGRSNESPQQFIARMRPDYTNYFQS